MAYKPFSGFCMLRDTETVAVVIFSGCPGKFAGSMPQVGPGGKASDGCDRVLRKAATEFTQIFKINSDHLYICVNEKFV